MSNYYFNVSVNVQVGIPLDQVYDDEGNIVNESTSRDVIYNAICEEIKEAALDQIKDGFFDVQVDSYEVECATDLIKQT